MRRPIDHQPALFPLSSCLWFFSCLAWLPAVIAIVQNQILESVSRFVTRTLVGVQNHDSLCSEGHKMHAAHHCLLQVCHVVNHVVTRISFYSISCQLFLPAFCGSSIERVKENVRARVLYLDLLPMNWRCFFAETVERQVWLRLYLLHWNPDVACSFLSDYRIFKTR